MRLALATVLSLIAAAAAAGVIWGWWWSPIPTFRVFTPLLHGMLLGVGLHCVFRALKVTSDPGRLTLAAVVAYLSVIALMWGQYVADAYAWRSERGGAIASVMPGFTAQPRPGLRGVLDEYDDNVLAATGKTGMRGYVRLQDRRVRWRGLLRFGEALIVIVTATVIASWRERAPDESAPDNI
jgi:hypothetical protein